MAIASHVYWLEPAEPQRPPIGPTSLFEQQAEAIDPGEADRHSDLSGTQAGITGVHEGYRLYELGDTSGAETVWRRGASHGDLESTAALGLLLWKRGEAQGETWTRLAATNGQVEAMNNLGLIHDARAEWSEAETWFSRAAQKGDRSAAHNLGTLLERTGRPAEAERWLAVAAKAGDLDAANNLGKVLFDRGDVAEAIRWFTVAAEAGHVQAAYNLGHACERRGQHAEAEA